MKTAMKFAAAGALFALSATAAAAQDVTLRVHHFMSEKAPLHSEMLTEFKQNLETKSDGRIAVELFPSMSLGGRPGDLYDQAVDGAVDIILTLPGYTPGRFNRTEVFELPFMMEDQIATANALWELVDTELQDAEYDELQVLSAWVHGPGVLHSKEPITKLEDMQGQEMRGPTRVVTDLLGELGTSPVGMPLPLIPENLSKGVISGTVLPWEITVSIKLSELVGHHTEISGDKALYTATFVLAMNQDVYDDLPDDLRALVDAESGKAMSTRSASVMGNADAFGRTVAEGNAIHVLDEAEVARWIEAAQPVYDRWIARAAEEGFDGQAAIDQARALIASNM